MNHANEIDRLAGVRERPMRDVHCRLKDSQLCMLIVGNTMEHTPVVGQNCIYVARFALNEHHAERWEDYLHACSLF